jgi:cytochrome c
MEKRLAVAVSAVALALTLVPVSRAAAVPLEITDEGKPVSGDPEKGAVVFKKCAVCHSVKAGENRIGPSLNGVIGRTAGTVAGFNYSTANKSSGIVWSQQQIYTYLIAPQKTIPGTKMSFPGLAKGEDRADVIAYLASVPK